MPDVDLGGRQVLVIGATGALGAGLASAFATAGAGVTGVDQVLPAPQRQLPGISYQAVNVLDDTALGALFDQGPPPWADQHGRRVRRIRAAAGPGPGRAHRPA